LLREKGRIPNEIYARALREAKSSESYGNPPFLEARIVRVVGLLTRGGNGVNL